MPITNVAPGDSLKASKINEIISFACPAFSAGSIVVWDYAPTTNTVSTSMVKVRELQVGVAGTVRVLTKLEAYTGYTSYLQVYKNGAAVGTLRSYTGSGGLPSAEFADDVTVTHGDLIQVYMRTGSTSNIATLTYTRLGVSSYPVFQPYVRNLL